MSVGSWGLTGFGLFTGIAAAIQLAQDGFLRWLGPLNALLLRLPARLIGLVGSTFGFFVAGYTGVLLAATAVPLWARNALLLGPLFISSALSNATAAITLILALMRGTSTRTLKRLEQLDMVAMIAELGLILAIKTNAGSVIGRPLREGTTGTIHKWGVLGLGITAPLLIGIKSKITGKTSRLEAAVSSVMILVGGFLLRYVMVMAGRGSADDPQATFEYARLDGQGFQGEQGRLG
jgi:formate-dependent nitrite reductase membrane component NrfD